MVRYYRGGNPDTMDNVDSCCGASTEAIAAEGLIVTVGRLTSTHIIFSCQDLPEFGLIMNYDPSFWW